MCDCRKRSQCDSQEMLGLGKSPGQACHHDGCVASWGGVGGGILMSQQAVTYVKTGTSYLGIPVLGWGKGAHSRLLGMPIVSKRSRKKTIVMPCMSPPCEAHESLQTTGQKHMRVNSGKEAEQDESAQSYWVLFPKQRGRRDPLSPPTQRCHKAEKRLSQFSKWNFTGH